MSVSAILGAQWGDEGKGKLVDMFAPSADLVVRFQGGPNAGHTIIVGKTKIVLHHIPSALLHDRPMAVMAEGMAVCPETLLKEINLLREAGATVTPDRLRLSLDAQIILPIHRHLDRAREEARGKGAIGTTLRGMGPTYEDRAARRGIRFRDLQDSTLLQKKLDRLMFERNTLLQAYGQPTLSVAEITAALTEWYDVLGPFFAETSREVSQAIADQKNILFEGAQGAMLDLSFGTYPYVTSSHTVSGGITIGAGIPPHAIKNCLGITKAYTTRVGGGPFPSELTGSAAEHLANVGAEFGATTGRPRRCGWLDLVALKYAHQLCGFTSLAVTKLDVLSGLDKIGVCVAYQSRGKQNTFFPKDCHTLEGVEQVCEWIDGWDTDISGCRRREDLPGSAVQLLDLVETYTGVPVSVVSVGPERTETITDVNPLWDAS